jgi:hypothetical protein
MAQKWEPIPAPIPEHMRKIFCPWCDWKMGISRSEVVPLNLQCARCKGTFILTREVALEEPTK